MNSKIIGVAHVIVLLCACATPYRLVEPGDALVDDLRITANAAWNHAASAQTPYSRKSAQVWTRDGLLLDRLMIIPGIAPGETMFTSSAKDAVLPEFRVDMLPHEISEFVESSLAKVLGEGEVFVSTSGLRPQSFGDQQGALFDLEASFADGPDYRGLAGGFVANGKLYVIIFIGAHPYYFDKHHDTAEAIIKSARL